MDGQAPCGGELWAALATDAPPSGDAPIEASPKELDPDEVKREAEAFYAERQRANREAKEQGDPARERKRARALEAANEIERTAERIEGRIYLDLELLLGPIVADSITEYIEIATADRSKPTRFRRITLRHAHDVFVRAATDHFDDLSVFVTEKYDELRLCFRWNGERGGLDLCGDRCAFGAVIPLDLKDVQEAPMRKNKKGMGKVENLRTGSAQKKNAPQAAQPKREPGERFVDQEAANEASPPEIANEASAPEGANETSAPETAREGGSPETADENGAAETSETVNESSAPGTSETAEQEAPSSARDAWASVGCKAPAEDPETQARLAKRATVMEAVAYLFNALGKPVPPHLADPQAIIDRADAGCCPLCVGGAPARSPSGARPGAATAAKTPADRSDAARRAHETRRRMKAEAEQRAGAQKAGT